jgi:hypothetical protein
MQCSNPTEPVIVFYTHVIGFCFSETNPEIVSNLIQPTNLNFGIQKFFILIQIKMK